MPTKNHAIAAEIYQLKVTLLGTNPPIWRQLLVPADLTLAQLHDVLQIAMGWQECHLHEFSAGGRHFGRPDPEDRFMGMPPVEDERRVRVSSVLRRIGAKAIYTYDFGDSWEHTHCSPETPAGCSDPSLPHVHRRPTCLSPRGLWRYRRFLRSAGCS